MEQKEEKKKVEEQQLDEVNGSGKLSDPSVHITHNPVTVF